MIKTYERFNDDATHWDNDGNLVGLSVKQTIVEFECTPEQLDKIRGKQPFKVGDFTARFLFMKHPRKSGMVPVLCEVV